MAEWWGRAHGLVVRSEVPLPIRVLLSGATADIDLRVADTGPVAAYGQSPDGRRLAHVDYGDGAALTVLRRADDVVEVHFHDLAVARIASALDRVDLTLAADADPSLIPILFSGTVLSVVLALKGHPVVHASAVSMAAPADDLGVAFVGSSGMGKSTLATLLCRDGARLLTDDVLRTDVLSDGRVVAWPGATATRLRSAATSLAQEAAAEVTTTADGRTQASLALAPDTPVSLRALVIPDPSRTSTRVEVDRLTGADAVIALASFPRVLGWRDPVTSGEAHRHWGALARAVPVAVLTVPWGPPFPAEVSRQIAEAVLDLVG